MRSISKYVLLIGVAAFAFFMTGCGEDSRETRDKSSVNREAVETKPLRTQDEDPMFRVLETLSGTYHSENHDATFRIEIDEKGIMKFSGEAYWTDHQNPNNIHMGEVEGTARIDEDGNARWKDEYGNELVFSFSEEVMQVKETGQLGGLNVTFSGSYSRSEEPVVEDIKYREASLPVEIIDVKFTDVRWKYRREDITFSNDGNFHWNEREGSDHLIERIGTYTVETSEIGNRLYLRYETVINGERQESDEAEYFLAYDSGLLVLYTTGAVEAIFKSDAHDLEVKDYKFFADYEMYATDLLSPYFENYFAEGGEGPGTGLSLHFLFYDLNADTQITTSVSGMILFNGITSDYASYLEHNRVRSAELVLGGELHQQVEFLDTPIPRIVLFPQKTVNEAVLTVGEVYKGLSKDNRLCVSKVYFFGESGEHRE